LGWSSGAQASYCGSGRQVIFAGLNWESGEFITAVMREILERGFDCHTETIPGNTITFEQALANDDLQVVAEEWIERSEIWKKAAAAGQVRAIGNTFTGATEGWAVPQYVVKGDPARHIEPAAPGLTNVAQLAEPKYVALFRDPEQPTRGRFLNCPSGWTCEPENTRKLRAYGLEDRYIDFRPGTGPAMDAAIVSAYLQGQPLLFYYWSPSAIAGRMRLSPLEEPPYTPDCWKNMMDVDSTHHGCASPPSVIVYGVSSVFAAAAPEIVAVLAKATFPLAELNANLAAMAQAQRDARAQALLFLQARPEIWQSWVGPALATRINAGLQGQAGGADSAQAQGRPRSRDSTQARQ
jgi:glycine betaine/proline transport system substrate-binding protein